MKNAAKNLVRYALSRGDTVSVYDGEAWSIKRSTSYREILDEIASVEEAQIRIRNAEGVVVAWALVSLYGMEPDETIIDCSDNDYMARFDAMQENPAVIDTVI